MTSIKRGLKAVRQKRIAKNRIRQHKERIERVETMLKEQANKPVYVPKVVSDKYGNRSKY